MPRTTMIAGLVLSGAFLIATPTVAQQAAGYDAASQAYALMQEGRVSEAVEAARRAHAAEPSNLEYGLLLADALLRADRPGEAHEVLGAYAGVEDYRLHSRRAEAATRAGRAQDAVGAWRRAADTAPDADSRAYAARSEIAALNGLGDLRGAREAFDREWAAGTFNGTALLDTAYLAVSVGRDAEAQQAFAQADATAPLNGADALNAGYSARRAGQDEAAVRWFARGLDSWPAGDPSFDEQRRHEIRREVETLERGWGGSATVSHGAASTTASGATGADTVVQAGGEVYRRIGGYNDGRPLDVFARVYATLDSDLGGAVGADTAQGWIGVRYKPLSQTNLVLEASRMIGLGDLARDDWMLRAAWSAEQGGDLRFDRNSWPAWRLYADVAHMVDADQTLGVAEARLGQAYRTSPHDIVTPFVTVRAYYDSLLADEVAVGAGPGVSWRRWFRPSRHGAPASYLELTLGYQFGLSGDDRGEGVFVGVTLNY